MKCPHCAKQIARQVMETSGKNDVKVGDVILNKSLVVVKKGGGLRVKCSGCKAMVDVKLVPALLVPHAGKID